MNIIKYYAGYLVRYLRGTRAVAAMEYAIIVGVVVVGVGAAVVLFQTNITDVYYSGRKSDHRHSGHIWRGRRRVDRDQVMFPFGLAGAKPGWCRPRCAGPRVPSFV